MEIGSFRVEGLHVMFLGLCGVVPFVFVMSARRTLGGALGGWSGIDHSSPSR